MTETAVPEPEEEFVSDRLIDPRDRARSRLRILRYLGWLLGLYGLLLKLIVPTAVALIRGETLETWWQEVSLLWIGVLAVALLAKTPTRSRLRAAVALSAALGLGVAGHLFYEFLTGTTGHGFAAFSHVYYGAWVLGYTLFAVPVLSSRHLREAAGT
ncbi:MAG: hypothetical protein D6729_03440 [Deltaproteobacteria bacterium]|nr:MAG: hypothetical protein D6729_03440 [Deltaproteobacteria bacterium]